MFRRKHDREPKERKGNEFDPFGISFDTGNIKIDDAALERELAAMLSGEENEKESKIPESKVRFQLVIVLVLTFASG